MKQPDQICAILRMMAAINRFAKETIVWGVTDAMEIATSDVFFLSLVTRHFSY